MYNNELREVGLETTQCALLMGLSHTGETTQGELGSMLGLDSTSLTRMLGLLKKRGWVVIRLGSDRRQRLVRISASGRDKLRQSRTQWKRAQARLRKGLGVDAWNQMADVLTKITQVSLME
jgi:DNA-binding MarR family transcriptional regulator